MLHKMNFKDIVQHEASQRQQTPSGGPLTGVNRAVMSPEASWWYLEGGS